MFGMFRDLLVDFGHVLHRATAQVGDEGVARGLLFGKQRIVVRVDHLVDRLAASVPQEKNLQRALPRSAAGGHYVTWRSVRSKLAISMAVMAASKPLLPPLAPARSMACSSVLVVRTPNATGTPVSAATCATPLAASAAT